MMKNMSEKECKLLNECNCIESSLEGELLKRKRAFQKRKSYITHKKVFSNPTQTHTLGPL